MSRLQPLRALLGLLFLGFAACEEGTPVSPPGAIIRISANPTRIGKTGTSTLTLQVLRSNGIPVPEGTEVRLSTNIGIVDSVIHTDDDGVALGTLRGDGRVGTATVTAHSGNVDEVEVEVEVGALATVDRPSRPTRPRVPMTGGNGSAHRPRARRERPARFRTRRSTSGPKPALSTPVGAS